MFRVVVVVAAAAVVVVDGCCVRYVDSLVVQWLVPNK